MKVLYFLLALVAEVLSWLAFAAGYVAGACAAAYARGRARGYAGGVEQQEVVYDDA
jgi:hypothetical protein